MAFLKVSMEEILLGYLLHHNTVSNVARILFPLWKIQLLKCTVCMIG